MSRDDQVTGRETVALATSPRDAPDGWCILIRTTPHKGARTETDQGCYLKNSSSTHNVTELGIDPVIEHSLPGPSCV